MPKAVGYDSGYLLMNEMYSKILCLLWGSFLLWALLNDSFCEVFLFLGKNLSKKDFWCYQKEQ